MNVGEKLRKLRLDKKETLEEESKNLGVSLNSIYRWEHGLSAPRKVTLKKIADFYGVSLEWLLQEDSTEDGRGRAGGVPCDEDQLLKMYRKLSEHDRYKVLGYIERMCVEDDD